MFTTVQTNFTKTVYVINWVNNLKWLNDHEVQSFHVIHLTLQAIVAPQQPPPTQQQQSVQVASPQQPGATTNQIQVSGPHQGQVMLIQQHGQVQVVHPGGQVQVVPQGQIQLSQVQKKLRLIMLIGLLQPSINIYGRYKTVNLLKIFSKIY